MKTLLHLVLTVGCCLGLSAAEIGEFSKAADVGNPKIKGSSSYDVEAQAYTLRGGGYNIWFNHDEFHILYRPIKGDFLLTANFQLIGNDKGNNHRKTGWMIRENTDHDAVSVNTCLHGDGLAVLQWRLLRGAYMRDPQEEIFFPKPYFREAVIQLERIGKTITMRIAHPGEPLEEMGSVVLPDLKDEVLIGPYVLAHDPDGMQEARVWNVRISTPVPPDWHPNRLVKTASHEGLVMGSRLEALEVTSGKRRVIYETEDRIAAPFLINDGQAVLFEKSGQSYSVSLNGGTPKPSSQPSLLNLPESDGTFTFFSDNKTGTSQIWMGKADRSDARQLTFDLDHAWFPHISPDKKWIVYLAYPHDVNPQKAVSYQRVSLKIMPVAGGAPRTIAYLFGGKGSLENPCWSPDGKHVVFVSNSVKH